MTTSPLIDVRFAISAIGYLHASDYVRVRLASPAPCHLFLHYTPNNPLKHPLSRTIRGLKVPWGVYFCFTGYKTVEQEEDGDTLFHTFTVPDWPICETRYMIATGTVAGVDSPSCGPIISHHNSGWPPVYYDIYPTGLGSFCQEQIQGYPYSCPLAWWNVSENPDVIDDAYVWTSFYVWRWHSHAAGNIPHPEIPVKIASLEVYIRLKRRYGYSYADIAKAQILIGVTRYISPEVWYLPEYYAWYTWPLPLNPSTHLPWTAADINATELGYYMRCYRGVGWEAWAYCSQVLARVHFDFLMG